MADLSKLVLNTACGTSHEANAAGAEGSPASAPLQGAQSHNILLISKGTMNLCESPKLLQTWILNSSIFIQDNGFHLAEWHCDISRAIFLIELKCTEHYAIIL